MAISSARICGNGQKVDHGVKELARSWSTLLTVTVATFKDVVVWLVTRPRQWRPGVQNIMSGPSAGPAAATSAGLKGSGETDTVRMLPPPETPWTCEPKRLGSLELEPMRTSKPSVPPKKPAP